MRVVVDFDRCVGAGQCVRFAPEVFDQREDDGTVILLAERPAAALAGEVREAAEMCPARVIVLEED